MSSAIQACCDISIERRKIIFGVTIWSLWKMRNEFIFNGVHCEAQQMFCKIKYHVDEIVDGGSKLKSLNVGKVESFIGWSFPKNDWVKVNVDGACVQAKVELILHVGD